MDGTTSTERPRPLSRPVTVLGHRHVSGPKPYSLGLEISRGPYCSVLLNPSLVRVVGVKGEDISPEGTDGGPNHLLNSSSTFPNISSPFSCLNIHSKRSKFKNKKLVTDTLISVRWITETCNQRSYYHGLSYPKNPPKILEILVEPKTPRVPVSLLFRTPKRLSRTLRNHSLIIDTVLSNVWVSPGLFRYHRYGCSLLLRRLDLELYLLERINVLSPFP